MGDRVYSVPIKHRCRIDYNQTVATGTNGAAYPSVAKIYLDERIHPQDKFAIMVRPPVKPAAYIGRIDYMMIDRDVLPPQEPVPAQVDKMDIDREAFLAAGWIEEGEYITRNPISVKNLYDGMGRFSHAEVTI